MRRTVVVTGGCGFIGSHFVRLLRVVRPEWRVVNLDKLTYAGNVANLNGLAEDAHYRFVRGDIADGAAVHRLFQEEGPWAVVNFAAESHVDRSILDPSPFLQTNLMGVQVLLHAAQHHRVERFVQISTDEVYGDAEGMSPFTEDAPLRPSSPYAASKAAADLLSQAYRRTYGVDLVIVRSANNYGPFQFPEKLIPLMIRNALVGEDLPVYGDGRQVRDWLYVEDNCEAILRVLERGQAGSIYNVETGQHRPNLEIVRTICRLVAEQAGLDVQSLLARIRFVPDRPGHDRRYAIDASRVRADLGWAPGVTFEDGLNRTVRWYLDHQDWVQQVTSGQYRSYYEAVYHRNWGSAPR